MTEQPAVGLYRRQKGTTMKGYPVKTVTAMRGMQLELHKYPNFSATGSIRGMKKLYYGENACLIRCNGFVYNVPYNVYSEA
jgi:hypothetical protein